jgi:hypothetical protein
MKFHDITVRPTYPTLSDTLSYNTNTELCNSGVFLPSYTELTESDICYISSLIKMYNYYNI